MKNIYFLCSLPRAGNTLLGSIVNSNKNIKLTPNSLSPDILYQLQKLKNSDLFKNFPNHKSLDNLISSALYEYYKDWDVDNIIDRSTWGTPGNLETIQNIFEKPKFIILLRPVVECIASLCKIEFENGNRSMRNIQTYIDTFMNFEKGILGKSIWSIHNIIKTNQDYKIFYFKDLVNDTDKFLDDLSNFIGVKIKKPKLLNQFNINGVYYQDEVHTKNLHKIRTDCIKLDSYDLTKYVPLTTINQFKNFEKVNEHFNS
jgi:hypothetical protein